MNEADMDLPPLQYDPAILNKVSNAHDVMHAAIDEMCKEQERVADSHAEHISRCKSVLYALLAEAYSMGFTQEQVSLTLDCDGD